MTNKNDTNIKKSHASFILECVSFGVQHEKSILLQKRSPNFAAPILLSIVCLEWAGLESWFHLSQWNHYKLLLGVWDAGGNLTTCLMFQLWLAWSSSDWTSSSTSTKVFRTTIRWHPPGVANQKEMLKQKDEVSDLERANKVQIHCNSQSTKQDPPLEQETLNRALDTVFFPNVRMNRLIDHPIHWECGISLLRLLSHHLRWYLTFRRPFLKEARFHIFLEMKEVRSAANWRPVTSLPAFHTSL